MYNFPFSVFYRKFREVTSIILFLLSLTYLKYSVKECWDQSVLEYSVTVTSEVSSLKGFVPGLVLQRGFGKAI